MSLFKLNNIRIAGIAAGVPNTRINNLNNPLFEAGESEAFVKNIGIGYVHRAAEKSLTDLFLPVAQKLMEGLNWSSEDVKLLITVTQTPDYKIPPASLILQNKLGLSRTTPAFDINLGCSGYVYGLSVTASMMQATGASKALLCVGDVSSACISEKDKSTAPVFSDAVSVTALELTHNNSDNMIFNLMSDGSGYDAIIIPEGGSRHPLTPESLLYETTSDGISRRPSDMTLNGIQVFNFSLREVASNIKELLLFAESTTDAIDYLLLHQANKLMNESIRKKMGMAPELVPSSLYTYGNTSSASIPVTIVHTLGSKLSEKDCNLLLSGFGVGLSWGSVLLRTRNLYCHEMLFI